MDGSLLIICLRRGGCSLAHSARTLPAVNQGTAILGGGGVGHSENHKNVLGICPECYYYVLVYYKTGFEEKN